MVEVKIGNQKFNISENKANYLKDKYSQEGKVVIKEFGGQALVIIGDLILGTVAMDTARDIISDIEKE